tara:strand:+ start:440 stop:646 length:207 start_codon:yes stop_codon:yes gene_type:complete
MSYSILRTVKGDKIEYLKTQKSLSYFRTELQPTFVVQNIASYEEADEIEYGFTRSEVARKELASKDKI